MPNHGKGGRKPERDEIKRAAVAVRTTPTIKAKLEDAAREAGRSVTQEIEARLEASVGLVATAESHDLLGQIAREIRRAEELTGKRWHKDLRTWAMVREALASGPIVQHCPPADRLASDLTGDTAQLRQRLANYGQQISSLMLALCELGFLIGQNPESFRDITASRYNYDDINEEKLSEADRPAAERLFAKMQQLDTERSADAEEYRFMHGLIVECIEKAVAEWQADLAQRGLMQPDEYRPVATLVPIGGGGMFVQVPAGMKPTDSAVIIGSSVGAGDVVRLEPIRQTRRGAAE